MPRLLLVDGQFSVTADAAVDRPLQSRRRGSRKSSRRSSQQQSVGKDADVSITPDVTQGDRSDVTSAAAESTADNSLYCECFVDLVCQFSPVFTARAYARAVLGVVILSVLRSIHPSVRLSVCHTRAL